MISTKRRRTSKNLMSNPLFVRGEYNGECGWDIALIKACHVHEPSLQLLSFQSTKLNDKKNVDKVVHFFVDDQKFEVLYNHPKRHIRKLAQYKYVLTPDFSLLTDMPLWVQLYNLGKSRWCGKLWQEAGVPIIPTVCWSTPDSYSFVFLGLEKGTTVAISTLSVRSGKMEQELFLNGYREMIARIEPNVIYCYGRPFPEMEGNIIEIGYNSTIRRSA